jgi:hypothetical protein
MKEKISDWIVACTSGKTIDGREITDDMIVEIATNYDPELKTAGLNWDHDHWEQRTHYGEVIETKLTEKKGRKALAVKINANEKLLDLYSEGQAPWFSAEIHKTFPINRGVSGYYLTGLAITPDPACLALDKISLSRQKNDDSHLKSEFLKSNLDKVENTKEPEKFNILEKLHTFMGKSELALESKMDQILSKFNLITHNRQARLIFV